VKFLTDFDVRGKRILVRCDFNVPLSDGGAILDDAKIKEALPTLDYLLEGGATVIIITHLGDGEANLDGIAKRLGELLGRPIPGEQITMLENIRSHQEEMDNREAFAKKLAALGDIYINEAFDVCHRAHASVAGIPKYLPHGAGFALQKEVAVLSQIMQRPARPMVAIIGGAKAETKAKLVDPFCAFADTVIVGGLIKQELIDKKIPLQYPEKVIGPKDDLQAPDISGDDVKKITQKIRQAKTIFWNGPFGNIENPEFATGTRAIANAIIKSGAFCVVGGGQTIAFLRKEGILEKFGHASTAGGAMLSYLAGEELPGLTALEL